MTSAEGLSTPEVSVTDNGSLTAKALKALENAIAYAICCIKSENYWHGDLYCDITVTCQYVFLLTWLKLDVEPQRAKLITHLRRQQRPNGSWAHSDDVEGAVSPSVEAYLALKILGVEQTSPEMITAREFIQDHGGIGAVRVITRIWIATFGLISWQDLPFSPAEIILIPPSFPFSIYKFAPWARSLIVPWLIILHHRPIFALPNGASSENSFLDELWKDPHNKHAPYGLSLWTLLWQADWLGLLIMLGDTICSFLSYIGIAPLFFIRSYALAKCLDWVLSHFEITGDYNPGYPPGFLAILAIHLEGVAVDDPRMQRALTAIEKRHLVVRADEMNFRTCTTPLWDTVLMCQGIVDSPSHASENHLNALATQSVNKALKWAAKRQYLEYTADWSVKRPGIGSGGFCIQYFNTWNLDIDDTSAAIVAFLKHDPALVGSDLVRSALDWIIGMQSSNGGWAAFEADNDNFYLRKLPFCDCPYLVCDPPVPDVTGHALEVLGLALTLADKQAAGEKAVEQPLSQSQMLKIRQAIDRGVRYLVVEQEVNGAWFGRWQCNYIFGTNAVLCGLEQAGKYYENSTTIDRLVGRGLQFLRSWQNMDGGWGESNASYYWKPDAPNAESAQPIRDSTISQTAWALMALLAYVDADDEAVVRGIDFLITSQRIMLCKDFKSGAFEVASIYEQAKAQLPSQIGTWSEDFASGAAVPGWMSLKYEYYPHYFPMMALGRYLKKMQEKAW